MVLLVTEGLVVEIAFGLYRLLSGGGSGLKVKLGLSRNCLWLSHTPTTQTLGKSSILLKCLAMFGMALAICIWVGTTSTSTIYLSVILPAKTGGKLHQPQCNRGG